jgi:hypothetical protein
MNSRVRLAVQPREVGVGEAGRLALADDAAAPGGAPISSGS